MDKLDKAKEKHLVSRIQNGDIIAFAQLVRQYSAPVMTLIQQLVPSKMDAEDITQEVFIKVYRGIGHFRGDSSFFTWLYKITKNACYSYLQKKQPAMLSLDIDSNSDDIIDIEPPAEQIDDLIARKDTNERILGCLNQIAPKYKIVIHLYYYQGLQYNEIAEILEIPMGTVQTHLSRGLKLLRKKVIAALA